MIKEGNLTKKKSWAKKLRRGLSKTHRNFIHKLEKLFRRHKSITPELLEEVEELLISADLGMNTTRQVVSAIERRLKRKQLKDYDSIKCAIQEKLEQILTQKCQDIAEQEISPSVILMLGVNGVGKTTTIGKMAYRYKKEGKRVMLAAADTFRAAACEQLQIWGKRVGIDVIGYQKNGADPSAVVYDAVSAAIARKIDVLLIDTAGRLHTKKNLMQELKKMKRVAAGCLSGAPHETLLVLDATTGQNAVAQANKFHQDIELTGLIITKLDGTAKGGVAVAIVNDLDLPVKMIGVGEDIEDLQDFNAGDFVSALFEGEEND